MSNNSLLKGAFQIVAVGQATTTVRKMKFMLKKAPYLSIYSLIGTLLYFKHPKWVIYRIKKFFRTAMVRRPTVACVIEERVPLAVA